MVHVLPYNALRAPCGIDAISRHSVRPSVCLSVTLMYRDRTGWVSLKVIIRVISLGSLLLGAPISAI